MFRRFAGALLALSLLPCPHSAAIAGGLATVTGWPRENRRESYANESDGRHGFLLAGLGLWSSSSQLLATGWGLGGGVTLPINGWALVPRLDWEGASDSEGSGWMVRGSLGGRLSHELAGRHTYTEGGLGVAFHEITAPADGPYSGSARVARSATSACFQLSSGVTSDPVQRPGFIIEGQWVLSTGEDAPSVLLGRVGILF